MVRPPVRDPSSRMLNCFSSIFRNDFVYMVPPFLAYYGVLTGNTTLISEAHNQIRLYRKYLKEEDSGLWMHVVMGSDFEDRGHWTTGNGWAAAGMLRVLATIQHSQYSDDFSDERSELKDWVNEIHASMYDKIVRHCLKSIGSLLTGYSYPGRHCHIPQLCRQWENIL